MSHKIPCSLVLFSLVFCSPAAALITGGTGNGAMKDPGWPAGAVQVFNVDARVAWWEGPPFGGGRWVAECRGDATAFNSAISDFAKIEAPVKTLFVHDGVTRSVWLKAKDELQRKAAVIDWTFTVWVSSRFEQLKRGGHTEDASSDPILHLYVGGNVNWSDVKVPDGVTVVDERLEAHGFADSDGTVLEGRITDLQTSENLMKGRATLQSIKPRKKGGYDYEDVRSVEAVDGRWVMKAVPEGWYLVVVSSPGYAPRIAKHCTVAPGPRWIPADTSLTKPAKVDGVVTGPDGKPLAGVRVRLDDVKTESGRYETSAEGEVTTGEDGRFVFRQHPQGSTRVWCYKQGYSRPGLGLEVNSPASGLTLKMISASTIRVSVDFGELERPKGYILNIGPEGGSVIGSWGGSANIDESNEFTFKNVPPGRYVLTGRPNPGSTKEETDPMTIELKGGESKSVVLKAKAKG